MILIVIVLFISLFILIPIVFTVQKTNNKVLGLFGIVPTKELENLCFQCQTFSKKFFEHKPDDSHETPLTKSNQSTKDKHQTEDKSK